MEFVLFMALFVIPAVIFWMWWAGAFHFLVRILATGLLIWGFWYSWTSDNYFGVLLNPSIYVVESLVTVETEERLQKELYTEDEKRNDFIRASVAMQDAFMEMGYLSEKLYDDVYDGDKDDWLNDFDEQLARMKLAISIIDTEMLIQEQELEQKQIEEFQEFKRYMYVLQEMVNVVRNDDSTETEEGFVYGLWLFYGDFGISEMEENKTQGIAGESKEESAEAERKAKEAIALAEAKTQAKKEAAEEAEAERVAENERQKEAERAAALKKQAELERRAEVKRMAEAKQQAEVKRQAEVVQPAKEQTQHISIPAETVVVKESYKNCDALTVDYPNGVNSSHPAYDSKHDRDNDGYACEQSRR